MRLMFAALFGIVGFALGVTANMLIVMLAYHTFVPGIDYFTGLPLAMLVMVVLILTGGLVLGGTLGYKLGARL